MIRLLIVAFASAVLGCSASAASIPDSEASSHIGQTVTLDCNVASIHASGGGTTFVNCGAPYPRQNASLVVFAGRNVGNLQQYQGRHLLVRGTLKLYKDRPEIVLDSAAQIQRPH
ncbi:MAG TPA: hypothetical protein VK753_10805 [Xanthomonadaceae bacterium]|jgi:hypothetical protein|nr:hypothetical protein [Xanthomonadaceae bacterium]